MRTSAEKEVTRDIKEKLCFVALDYEEELKNAKDNQNLEKNYILPDGQEVILGSERFVAPEVLFQPGLMGYDVTGVHEAADRCIKSVI